MGSVRPDTVFEAIGGEPTFRRLVETFYEGVAADPVLRALYPEDDLGPADDRLRMFLIQYWGGPTTYSDQRGHPRLRMRHAPFAVNAAARDAWLRHMRVALDSLDLAAELRARRCGTTSSGPPTRCATCRADTAHLPAVTLNASGQAPWWADAVFYQVYPRSFADGNGDGSGDLIGLRERLDHLVELGIDALWISPFFCSPMADNGYDVSDPCDVDPMFGTLADFDALLADAHARGIKVTIDVVPNHFSDQHPWFQAALAAGPGSPERARFIFRPGRGADGELPPNNWPSAFGGPAWARVPDGEWYLHLFAPEQPDLDWTNPEVPAEFERVFRFWLDRGVDGFRIDVGQGMAKPDELVDMDLAVLAPPEHGSAHLPSPDDLRWDQPRVHEYHRGFRRVLDSYPGDRMAVGEVWVADDERLARYVRPDELNLAFNFELVVATFGAAEFRKAIESSIQAMEHVGAPCTWVLGNHDVDRPATRYGGGAAGVARARAAALVQLSLARRGLHLQRRGTRAGQRRPARRRAARPDLGAQRAHPARARRRAGTDAVVGHRAAVRIQHRGFDVVADAGRVGGAGRARPGGRSVLDAAACTARRCGCAARCSRAPARSSGWTRRSACSPTAAAT